MRRDYRYRIAWGKKYFIGWDTGWPMFLEGEFLPAKKSLYTRYYKYKKAAKNAILKMKQRGFNVKGVEVEEIPSGPSE